MRELPHFILKEKKWKRINRDRMFLRKLINCWKQAPKRRKKGKLKWILIGVLVLVLLFIAKNVLFPAKPRGTMVSVQALTKGDIQEKISLSGPVSGTDAQQVTSGLHAKVTEILVKEGDKVEKGQVLARLDKTGCEYCLGKLPRPAGFGKGQ